MKLINKVFLKKKALNFRSFTTTEKFGTEFFHGPRDYDSRRELEPSKKDSAAKFYFFKYKSVINQGVDNIFFKSNSNRSVFNIDSPGHRITILGSTNQHDLQSDEVTDELFSRTRGYTIQLSILGKGCRAYFDPEWPHLKYKGRGIPIDFTNVCIREAKDARVYLSKTGLLITIHGYNLIAVRRLAFSIQSAAKVHLYSMKGISFSDMPPIQRQRAKKK